MERIFIIIIILGAVLVFFGVQEYIISAGTSDTPQSVELADLEMNPALKNNYIKIGGHWSVYWASIYEYSQSKYDTSEPTDSTKINFAYYPIISNDHEYISELAELGERYGDDEDIPDDAWPEIRSFAVLVKTERFKTVGEIPADFDSTDEIEGLVVNKIKSLSSDERKLLLESFPAIDIEKVLLLDEGRKPLSPLFVYGLMILGTLMVAGPVIFIVKQNMKKKQPPSEMPLQPPVT